jgi:predicted lipoprotein with Yx(FWY)xxD motif
VSAVTGLAVLAITAAGAPARSSLTTVSITNNGVLGTILVTAGRRTLYHESSEPRNSVKCTGTCASLWPPLLLASGAKPIPGPGITASLLGTVKRPGGKLQVTYRGLALYLYSGDAKAGQVKGQGVGGVWHAIAPSGLLVTKAATTSAGTTGSSTGKASGSTSSSSSGSTSSGSSSGSSTSGSGSNSGSGTSSADAAYCAANPMACFNGVPAAGG